MFGITHENTGVFLKLFLCVIIFWFAATTQNVKFVYTLFEISFILWAMTVEAVDI